MLTLTETITTLGGRVVACGLKINSRAANLLRVEGEIGFAFVISEVEPGVGGVNEVVAHPPTRDRSVAS